MPPDAPGARALTACVLQGFGVELGNLARVRGGADTAASVWLGSAADGGSYAVKVSHAGLSVGLRASWMLCRQGVFGVPEPVPALDGRLWASLGTAQVSLAPWITGRRAIDHEMSPAQWQSFGAWLAQVHALGPPAEEAALPLVSYQSSSTVATRRLDKRLRTLGKTRDCETPPDRCEGPADLGAILASVWRIHAHRLTQLADATETLSRRLRDRPAPRVVTHGDAHLGNLVIGDDGRLWVLDWDSVAVAAPERDLMFVRGGVLTDRPVTAAQQSCFFEGYGPADLEADRLAYFTCERALEDVTGWAASVLDEASPPEERAAALAIFQGLMASAGIVATAQTCLQHVEVGKPPIVLAESARSSRRPAG